MTSEKAKIAVPRKPIGIEWVRCKGEKALRERLLAQENVAVLKEQLVQCADLGYTRRDLLRHAMKVTPSMSPTLHGLLGLARKILDLGERQFEMFVFPSPDINAYVAPAPGGAVFHVALSSTVLEKFNQRELLTILGHELGHAIAGHSDVPIRAMLDSGGHVLSTLDAYKLMALSRYQEITADRASLLCSQDYALAAGCLLKSASGVTSGALQFSLPDYLTQLEEIKTLDDVADSSEDWFATHPFSPLRVKAMELFSRSDGFRRLTGTGDGRLSMSEIEAKLDEIMSIMNPSYLAATDEESQRQIKEWLATASVLVAMASGDVSAEEVARIGETIGTGDLEVRVAGLQSIGFD